MSVVKIKKVAPLTSAFAVAGISSDWLDKLRYIIYAINQSIDNVNDLQAQSDETNEKLSTVTERVTQAEADIDSLKTRMDNAEGDITTIKSDIATIQAELVSMKERLNTAEGNIETLQSDVTEINAKINTINERITAINATLVEYGERITATEEKNGEQDTRLESIEEKNVEQDTRLESIEEKDVEQDGRLEVLEQRVTTVEDVVATYSHEFTPTGTYVFEEQVYNNADTDNMYVSMDEGKAIADATGEVSATIGGTDCKAVFQNTGVLEKFETDDSVMMYQTALTFCDEDGVPMCSGVLNYNVVMRRSSTYPAMYSGQSSVTVLSADAVEFGGLRFISLVVDQSHDNKFEERLNGVDDVIAVQGAQIAELQAGLEVTKAELQEKITALESSFAELQSDINAKYDALYTTVSVNTNTIATLQNQISLLNTLYQQLDTDVKNAISKWEEEATAMQTSINNINATDAEQTSQILKLIERSDSTDETISDIKTKDEEQDAKLSEMGECCTAVQTTLNEQGSQIVDLLAKYTGMESTLTEVQNRNAEQDSEIAEIQSWANDVNTQLTAIENNFSSLESVISALNTPTLLSVTYPDYKYTINGTSVTASEFYTYVQNNETFVICNVTIPKPAGDFNIVCDVRRTSNYAVIYASLSKLLKVSDGGYVISSIDMTLRESSWDMSGGYYSINTNLTGLTVYLTLKAYSQSNLLQTDVDELKSRIDSIDSSIENMSTEQESLDARVTTLEDTCSSLASTVSGFYNFKPFEYYGIEDYTNSGVSYYIDKVAASFDTVVATLVANKNYIAEATISAAITFTNPTITNRKFQLMKSYGTVTVLPAYNLIYIDIKGSSYIASNGLYATINSTLSVTNDTGEEGTEPTFSIHALILHNAENAALPSTLSGSLNAEIHLYSMNSSNT